MKKIAITAAFVLAMAALPALAENAGQFTELSGSVSVKRASGRVINASMGTPVYQGDVIITARDGKGTMLFRDGSLLRVGPSSNLTINKLVYEEDEGYAEAAYNLAKGTLMSVVGSIFGDDDSSYEVQTPTAVSGVRGTMFIVKVTEDPETGELVSTLVGVEGTSTFTGNDGQGYNLGPGQGSSSGPGGTTPPFPVSDEMLSGLLGSVRVDVRSAGRRAGGLRQDLGGKTPPGFTGLPPVGGGPGLPMGPGDDRDNPSSIIYQEPPQVTEMILRVEIRE